MKKTVLGAALALASLSAFAAEFYIVVPIKNRGANSPIAVSLAQVTLPTAAVGSAYAYDLTSALTVTGDPAFTGTGVTWAVVGGVLPAGMSCSAGTLSGTPTAAGTSAFTVQATYKTKKGQASYSLTSFNARSIVQTDAGYRSWSDGSLAASCNGYLHPTAPHQYAGTTGDGVYRIQPSGQPVANVYCDMSVDGGGWTLAIRVSGTSQGHRTASAISEPTTPTADVLARLSDDQLNAIATTHYRITQGDSVTGVKLFFQVQAGRPWSSTTGATAASRLASTSLAGPYTDTGVNNDGSNPDYTGISCYNNGRWTIIPGVNFSSNGWLGTEWYGDGGGKGLRASVWVR